MSNVTMVETKTFIKKMLGTDPDWAKKALIRIYERQTDSEQAAEATHDNNSVGFTGIDGKILTSFAKFLQKTKFLTPKQMNIVFKKMPKYWNQILEVSDKQVLNSLIEKARG